MLILKTISHETIWGGNKLANTLNDKNKKIGHLYSLISNDQFESIVINGEYKEQRLKDFFNKNKAKYKLDKYENFPFIISLTDATDNLSIQVHPDDDFAQQNLKMPNGKNESWYFIEAPLSGKIYNGCKALSIEDLKQKIKNKKYEDIIDYLDVKTGDYVYIKAGTLHALSAGSLVFEIEENCNITYRLYDFERVDAKGKKRPLQTEKVLKTVDVNLKSKAEKYNNEKKERMYSTKLLKNTCEYTNKSNTLECLTIIKGCPKFDNFEISRGTTIILEPQENIQFYSFSDFIVSRPIIMEENK